MHTQGVPNSPFQGLCAYSPIPPYPHLRNTQLAEIREQWHQTPKTHRVGAIPVVPERYVYVDVVLVGECLPSYGHA